VLRLTPGLTNGERKSLSELKAMALTDPDVQNMTTEDEQVLINALREHRKAKKRNVRPNNKSAARDIMATMDHVTDEVSNGVCFTYFQLISLLA